jgi:hypothetical protein
MALMALPGGFNVPAFAVGPCARIMYVRYVYSYSIHRRNRWMDLGGDFNHRGAVPGST